MKELRIGKKIEKDDHSNKFKINLTWMSGDADGYFYESIYFERNSKYDMTAIQLTIEFLNEIDSRDDIEIALKEYENKFITEEDQLEKFSFSDYIYDSLKRDPQGDYQFYCVLRNWNITYFDHDNIEYEVEVI